MTIFIQRINQIDSQQELQIMDCGYGQIETYHFGKKDNKDFLSPAETHLLYLKSTTVEADDYLKSIR